MKVIMMNKHVTGLRSCPVCGGIKFISAKVLWPELICEWQLTPAEVDYIDRQQGTSCASCGNNMRAMALALAIMDAFSFKGTFASFCTSGQPLRVLEINRAGNLTGFLQQLSGHTLIEYPKFNMQDLDIPTGTYDLVIHSDTLEHVSNPLRGLSECRRVLKMGGNCIFTIPIIVDRMSRDRAGMRPSYHGSPDVPAEDQLVFSEFGVDFWKIVLGAGFRFCGLQAFEYPAALAVVASK
jgi:SAM-dependent methyltransferase